MLFPQIPSPTFAKFTPNFRETFTNTYVTVLEFWHWPHMMMSAIWKLGYAKTFARKKKLLSRYHRETFAKLSRSPLYPSWCSFLLNFLTRSFPSITTCGMVVLASYTNCHHTYADVNTYVCLCHVYAFWGRPPWCGVPLWPSGRCPSCCHHRTGGPSARNAAGSRNSLRPPQSQGSAPEQKSLYVH